MTTYSTLLRFTKQSAGENLASWGQILSDQVVELADSAIAGQATISTTGGDTTLSTNSGAADEARQAIVRVTGTLISNANLIVPATTKTWDVFNDTAGSYTVTVKVAAMTGVVIPQGGSARVAVTASGDVRYSGVPNASSASSLTLDSFMSPLLAGATNLGNPSSANDRIPIYDVSGQVTRFITASQITLDVPNLVVENSVDIVNDFLPFYDDSASANRKITVQNLWSATLNALDNVASIDSANDKIPIYDASGTAAGHITPNQVASGLSISGLDAETTIDLASDALLMYDATDLANNKVSPQAFFNALGTVANISQPDATADRVIVYDSDASATRYATINQITTSRTLMSQMGSH